MIKYAYACKIDTLQTHQVEGGRGGALAGRRGF